MRRWFVLIIGLVCLGFGAHLMASGQPGEGDYRYPRGARAEAKRFSRTIKDPKEKERFLNDTTGRIKIEHQRELFFGGTLCTLGLAFAFVSSVGLVRQSRSRKKKAQVVTKSRRAA
jgi:hypothetical protein